MYKFCVTGASGFFGKTIVTSLRDANAKCYTIGISQNDGIFCDLAKSIPKLTSETDCFIHAAGKAHFIPTAKEEENEFFKVNVEGTKNLLRGIERLGFFPSSFVFISTVAVYGLEKGERITEDTARLAKDPYGLSKIQAENYILEWGSKYNVRIGIIRPPLIVGHSAPGNLGAMIKGIQIGCYVNIDNGKAKRSMVLSEDLASFIPTIAKAGGIFHLTDGYHPSFGEISRLIAKRNKKRYIVNIPTFIAKPFSKTGDLIQLLTRREFPFNSRKYDKMTSSLTYSDYAAQQLGWNPRKVLENPDLWL